MERSELVAETLGEHVFDFFLRNKQQEWEEYRCEVTRLRAEEEPPGAVANSAARERWVIRPAGLRTVGPDSFAGRRRRAPPWPARAPRCGSRRTGHRVSARRSAGGGNGREPVGALVGDHAACRGRREVGAQDQERPCRRVSRAARVARPRTAPGRCRRSAPMAGWASWTGWWMQSPVISAVRPAASARRRCAPGCGRGGQQAQARGDLEPLAGTSTRSSSPASSTGITESRNICSRASSMSYAAQNSRSTREVR